LILDELGIGTSARGQDFNDILYRANPALKLANQVIGILARQKTELAALIDSTNTIASEAASHTGAAQNFLQQASTVASTTAQHSSNLELAIKRLPGLLAAAQPSLKQLDVVARDGTPLVRQLGVAAPYLNQASIDLGPFVTAAKPGLAKLSTALSKAIPSIKHTTPLVKELRSYTTKSLSKTRLSGRLFTSLQQSGFGENFLGIVYYVAAALSRFDSVSHILSFATVNPGPCLSYATTPVSGCDTNYGSAPATASLNRHAHRTAAAAPAKPKSATGTSSPSAGAGAPAGSQQAPASQSPAQQSQPAAPQQQQPAPPTGNTLQNLINFLLR
jgi:hypothetical protein